MEPLNRDSIIKLIGDEAVSDFELELHQQLDSTNSYLLNEQLDSSVKICLAETQINGRGRHGKHWHSPSNANIYVSFAHRLKLDVSELSGFSLMIGIALAGTLQKYCKAKIQVKWPNDLLVSEKKLSGILVEIKNETGGGYKIITGIGVNINMPDSSIGQPCIGMSQCTPLEELSRDEIAASLVVNILKAVQRFEHNGFCYFYEKWNKLDAWYNQPVMLEMGNKKISGIHRGIDLTGALLLEREGEISSWSSGEISLRRVS